MKAIYTFLLGCFCVGVTLAQSDIASVEYFFDTDPGFGNATIIDIDPDVELLNQNFNISTTGLSQGTHRLFMRVFNADGDVSMYVNKTFQISDSPETNISDITEVEYFFDTDPGIGNGTSIDINPNVELLNQNFSISTTGLSQGTHRLFIRVFHDDGDASMYANKTFQISDSPETNTSDITEAEYFFDTDPGIGNGINIDVSDTEILNENFVIPVAGLSEGTHRLFIRVKNSDNSWSIYDNKTFKVYDVPITNSANIIEAEYFFNTDPGIGNGTLIDLTDTAVLDDNLSIATTSLPVGTHRLFIRVKNEDNRWSIYANKTFRVSDVPLTNSADIVEAEYFIDTDPGIGNATLIDVADVDDLDELLNIITTGLPVGTHRLFLRVKNSNNRWSLYANKVFRVSDIPFTNDATITAAEYFFDVDPGFGNATPISVSGDDIEETINVSTSGSMSQGDHYLHIRVLNSDGNWSLYGREFFEIDGTLSTNSFDISGVKIYPNPTSDVISIDFSENSQITHAALYDINGKKVFECKNHIHQIDMSELESGIYLLQIETEKGKISKRIIKH